MMILMRKLVVLLAPAALLASPESDRIDAVVRSVAEHAADLDTIGCYLRVVGLMNGSNALVDSTQESIAQTRAARVVRQAYWFELQQLLIKANKARDEYDAILTSLNEIIESRKKVKRLEMKLSQKKQELAELKALTH